MAFDGLVQSVFFVAGHPVKALSADGHVDPSGQHELPAHVVVVLPGQRTGSPTLQLPPGAGGTGGDGVGGKGAVQSDSFCFRQPAKAESAEGQTEPSGQQLSPAQWEAVPGHITLSPTLHRGDGAGVGAGVGGTGVGVGVGVTGVGCGVGPGLGPVPSGHKVIT